MLIFSIEGKQTFISSMFKYLIVQKEQSLLQKNSTYYLVIKEENLCNRPLYKNKCSMYSGF